MFGKGQIFSVRTENFSFFSVFLSSFSAFLGCVHTGCTDEPWIPDRKSTRLNSSHLVISYAVFCLKKKRYHVPLHDLLALRLRALYVPDDVDRCVEEQLMASFIGLLNPPELLLLLPNGVRHLEVVL